jgi:hypothetical protein
MRARLRIPLFLVLLGTFLQGCLATWIHMEDGTVLRPGGVEFQVSAGTAPRQADACDEGSYYRKSTGECVSKTTTWTTNGANGTYTTISDSSPLLPRTAREPHFALTWALGILGPFGPFRGLEMGIQAEAPTYPVSLDYRLALGLPVADTLWAHSLEGGWGTGMWSDDSWFLQYSASRRFGPARLFANWRSTLQATRTETALQNTHFGHDRTWDHQVAAGAKVELGRIPVLPSWIGWGGTLDLSHSAQPSLDLTETPQPKGMGFAWNLTAGWTW